MSPAARAFATQISDLGDSAFICAILVIATFYLLYSKCYREAKALFLSVALTGAAIATLKILFLSCGNNILGIRSPSGHAALTTAFYGMYALLMYRYLQGWQRFLPLLFFIPLIVGIAVTRSLLSFHTESEVVVGVMVGSINLWIIWHIFLRGHPAMSFNTAKLLLWIALTGSLLYGFRLPAEPMIKHLASGFQERIRCENEQEPSLKHKEP